MTVCLKLCTIIDILIIIMNAIASEEMASELRPIFCDKFILAKKPSPPKYFLQIPLKRSLPVSKADGERKDNPIITRNTARNPK